MDEFKQQLLERSIELQALKFGEFTLKSGRKSPYFFNLGLFCKAKDLNVLCEAYARRIIQSGMKFDVLFGPAYKGIPLAALVSSKLYELGGKEFADICFSYNRKEKKDHGEGGMIVGGDISGKKVLIIDDVMTAGTAINEAYTILKENNAEVVGIITSLDRQEIAPGSEYSTTKTVSSRYNIPVFSIITLEDIVKFVKPTLSEENLKNIESYRGLYGAKN